MIRAALVFAAAFVLCASLGSAGAGCFLQSDCQCVGGPELPPVLPPRTISRAIVYTDASAPLDLRGGTMEIRRNQAFFRYESSGVTHEVVYKIFPNP